MGDWAVTAVNCSRTSRCESDSCAISAELGEADMTVDRWWGGVCGVSPLTGRGPKLFVLG